MRRKIGLQEGRFVDDERRLFNGASLLVIFFFSTLSFSPSSTRALRGIAALRPERRATLLNERKESTKSARTSHENALPKERVSKNVSAVVFFFFLNDLDLLLLPSVLHHHHHHQQQQQQQQRLLLLLLSPFRLRSPPRPCPAPGSTPGMSSASPTRAPPSPPCL